LRHPTLGYFDRFHAITEEVIVVFLVPELIQAKRNRILEGRSRLEPKQGLLIAFLF
jgi:hypothetical protein